MATILLGRPPMRMSPSHLPLLVVLLSGCISPGAKGPPPDLRAGKADVGREMIDHGELAWDSPFEAELAPDLGHRWTFTLAGPAKISLQTAGEPYAVDTVLCLHKDGEQLFLNDDGGADRYSQLELEETLEAGSYSVTVVVHPDANDRGWFSLTAGCRGKACELTDEEILRGEILDGFDDIFDQEYARDLTVPLEESPSGGTELTFCTEPEGVLQLSNAAWLSFFAANEYSHLAAFAPALINLGFGAPGAFSPDAFWTICARDLFDLEALEEAEQLDPQTIPDVITEGYLEDEFGTCSRQWFIDAFLQGPGADGDGNGVVDRVAAPDGLADRFKDYLIRSSDSDSYIQFFADRNGTQVVWARHSELPMVVVAFRGTEPTRIGDLLTNLQLVRRRLDEHGWGAGWGSVHRGFLDGYQRLVESLLYEKVRELEGTDVGIWVTGHSLGGALSTIFTSRLLADMDRGADYRLVGNYTFGAPRVGDPDFQERFDRSAHTHGVRAIRFRNRHDIVTRVPKLGYRHAGTLAYIFGNGDLAIAPKNIPWRLIGSPGDHSMVPNYYENILPMLRDSRYRRHMRCAVR